MRNTYDEKIRAWLAEYREEILQKWMDLVRIPSLQSKAEENAPYGKNCAEALKTAAGYFAARGFDVRIEAQDGYALADFGSGEKTIGLFAHCDVVPTGDGWLYTEPFTPVIRDGLLIGRGAADNKSGAMAALCIMAMAKELNIPLKSRIRTFLGTNEESGMADVEAFVRNEEMPDLSLVPDSAFPCALGEKGILRLWMQSGAALKQVLDFRGGSAFNIVLDRAEVTLAFDAALEAELREKISGNAAYTLTAEEGVLRLAAEGLAKHAADPEGSVNAAWLAASLLAGCSALCAEDRAVMAQTAVYFAAPWGESFGICHEDEHFGKLSAINGMAKVENGKLYLSLDVRYGASLPPQELEAKLHAAVESAGWQITELNNRPGYRVDPEGVVPRLMQSLYREVTGVEKDLFYMAGGTYARYLKNAYPVGRSAEVPDRTVAKATLPEGHGGVHQRDEAADLEEFFQAVRLLMHAVIACDERM